MSKICRTCLQTCNTAFKTSQELGNFGDGPLRISVVLRFCIPELYLGLSSNPEICVNCMENLKVAYLFKKRCLNTEQIIGNFLKNARCTGRSVDLLDVLTYFQETPGKYPDGNNPFEQVVFNTESPQVIDVHPNAVIPTTGAIILNNTGNTNFITDQSQLLTAVQKTINQNPNQVVNGMVTQPLSSDNLHETDTSYSMCKISSVFSLNGTEDNFSNFEDNINSSKTTGSAAVKEEPWDIQLDDRQMGVNCMTTDEDTLDSPEIAGFENSYSPSLQLQDFMNNVPGGNHPNQYIDVPDFVTINNFGFKELEEFRSQQKVNEVVNFNVVNEAVPLTSNPVQLDKQDETYVDGQKPELKLVKVLSNAPEVIILNGKRLVKCGNSYKVEEEMPPVIKQPVIQEAENLPPAIIGTKGKCFLTSNTKHRRKFKIVPVTDQHPGKKIKVDGNSAVNPKISKGEDKDVVVLFTNYTRDGAYVNDHDYLLSPYKRNKVLIEENSNWICMCYICNTRHHVGNHVEHMTTHGSQCKVCYTDLGTPYMYNIHVKAHKKPCRYCTQVLPYSKIKSHEEKHIREEKMYDDATDRKVYASKRGRRKAKKDEKAVYFPYSKQKPNDSENDEPQSNENKKTVIPEPESGNESDEPLNRLIEKSREKMKSDDDMSETPTTPRTLRRRMKRWYAESDDEDLKTDSCSVSKGTLSDLKTDEK